MVPTPTPLPPITTPADLVERVRHSVVPVRYWGGYVGTAVLIQTEDDWGYFASAYHVFDGAPITLDVEVQGDTHAVVMLGFDKRLDIAIFAACCSDAFIPVGWGQQPLVGDEVVAIGYPPAEGRRVVTRGVVMEPDYHSQEYGLLRHTAPLNRGNSGGPLFSFPAGEVVGINVQGSRESPHFYAVPYSAFQEMIQGWIDAHVR